MRHYFGALRLKGKAAGVFSPVHAPREQGASRNTSEKEKEKRTANAIRFSLCLDVKMTTLKIEDLRSKSTSLLHYSLLPITSKILNANFCEK